MVFSSMTFLTLFLPFVLGGYYFLFILSSKRFSRTATCLYANLFLLFASLVFYFWGEVWRVWVLAASCIANFLLARLMMWQATPCEGCEGKNKYLMERLDQLQPGGQRTPSQRFLLIIAIVLNISFLIYFKYYNFFIESITGAFPESWGIHTWAKVALPLGISFFTFESISYIMDVYRGDAPAEKNLINFSCYLTMFQHLVAGPVIRYRDLYHQLTNRTLSRDQFASGTRRFILGLAKKVLVANTVAVIADKAFELPPDQLTVSTAWLGLVCYTLQIYYDFSGYSDMAIGIARMFGFEFLENFNYPYFARSAQDFWRRWHISLSTWFRDYLYIALGGNRKSPLRTYFNLALVFFLCGLWHGANWVFMAWGFYHGFFLVLERFLTRGKKSIIKWDADRSPLLSLLGHIYAVLMAMGGWVLFRSETFTQAWGYYGALMGKSSGGGGGSTIWLFYALDVKIAIISGIVFSMPILPVLMRWRQKSLAYITTTQKPVPRMIFLGMEMGRTLILLCLLFICFLPLASGTHNPFIYFRF